jgi:malate dehydrogenase (quinone)
VIKRDPKKGGVLQFGTEVVSSADGTIAGLLGASPGASTAVPIMLGLIQSCFPDEFVRWNRKIAAMIPSVTEPIGSNADLAGNTMKHSAERLRISA